ncbi:GNAT family N-acetyltransferase [Brevibacillus reuszeri]|uniref:GNAT family N-acetyltransferase n=1 Tax=Brevibacillus reuszeri TaxID=54915 RepID=UPI003D22E908
MEHLMKCDVQLRNVFEEDLPVFFEQQLDSTANYMAAFTAKDPTNKDAFLAHWAKILTDQTIQKKTILFHGEVAGHISSFEQFGVPSVSYWIGKDYWGKGIATAALLSLLRDSNIRPLYARAAKDNLASIKVLEKCGFKITGEDKGFSDARCTEVEEFILILNKSESTDQK